MDFEQINQLVQTFFQQTNQPNIFYLNFNFSQCLETIQPKKINSQTSIKIMMDLIHAILYLKTNKLNPSQIKFSHVGCDQDNNWGLKHAICYRTINPPKNFQTQDQYDPTQFHYHQNQDNQLMWNLGKIWLRFYVNKKVSAIDTSQNQIDQLIIKNVVDSKIANIIKKMLIIKKDKRITFEKFIQDQVFAVQNSHQNLYSSICLHFSHVSRVEKVKNSLNNKAQIKNPYQEEIFRRDMKQALDIAQLLEKTITIIRSIYEKNAQLQFWIFIIRAEAFCILKNIDQRKMRNQINDYTMNERKFYSKFVTKMLTLKHQLQRKMKMKIFYGENGLNQKERQLLIPTNQMKLPKIHNAFKQIVSQLYLQSVNELKKIQIIDEQQRIKQIIKIEKRCLIFLLTRLCRQIFSELRSYIFEQYVKRISDPLKWLNIKDLLDFIQNCKDHKVLALIRKRVFENGLVKKAQSTKSIQK